MSVETIENYEERSTVSPEGPVGARSLDTATRDTAFTGKMDSSFAIVQSHNRFNEIKAFSIVILALCITIVVVNIFLSLKKKLKLSLIFNIIALVIGIALSVVLFYYFGNVSSYYPNYYPMQAT